MTDLPTGTVTFLFTDVEGSTRLWEEFPDATGPAMTRHDEIIETSVAAGGGWVVRPRGEGDSRFCVFTRPTEAVSAALAIQLALAKEPWNLPRPLKVRIGIHTGEAELRAGDYYGGAVNRCARLRGLGYGGQTLLSAVAEDLVDELLPPGVTLRDLGSHRLRDLGAPERVYQLCHPDLPDGFGPLRSVDAIRNNLPAELTSFIGREHEVSTVKKIVTDSRLVTLHGAAGCGKTRLALEVADELLGRFADGEWFVELAAVADPAMLDDAVASALGIREGDTRRRERDEPDQGTLRERIIGQLRGKRLLLVLDNCEHLVGAVAEFAQALLRACPDIHVMTTSREALGIDLEVAWRVPSLSTPDPEEASDIEALTTSEAARLFIERARQRRSDFTLTDADARPIAEICARLDGIPLAIELAASRVKMMTPAQIAQRLDDFFRLLVGGSRTALERQQTLRAAVDWSHEPLSEPERILFRRLSVFAGGFTLEAAEGVCAGEGLDALDLLDLLQSLVDKSLVEADVSQGSTRYRMLETFRQYAREKLVEAGEATTMRASHRDRFLELAEQSRSAAYGPRAAMWFERLEAEHDNLRAALEWSLSAGDDQEALRFGRALWTFWQSRGHHTEGRGWLEQILPLTQGAEPALAASILCGAMAVAAALGYGDEALAHAERAEPLAREAGLARELVFVMSIRILLTLMRGGGRDYASLEEAERIAREADDPVALVEVLEAKSMVLGSKGDMSASRDVLEEALGQARRTGDPAIIGQVSLRLGMSFDWEGDVDRARSMAETALELGTPGVRAWALFDMAELAMIEGDHDRARALIERGRRLERAHGFELPWEWLLGAIARREGDISTARTMYETLLESSRSRGSVSFVTMSLAGLAWVSREEGDLDGALRMFRSSLSMVADAGLRPAQGRLIGAIGGVLLAQGDAGAAAPLLAAGEVWCEKLWAKSKMADEQRSLDIAAARAALGDEEYERLSAPARDLELKDAVALALRD